MEVEYEYNEEDPAADNQLEKAIDFVKGNGMLILHSIFFVSMIE